MAFVGLDTMPGEYTFTVTVTDRSTKQSKQLSTAFEVVPLKFGLVRLMLSYPNGDPAPPLGVAGQSYLLNFTLINWELNKMANPDLLAEIQVLDEAGKPTLNQPIQGKLQNVTEEAKKLKVSPMQFPINLNRQGKFKINISATDKVSGKKVDGSLDLTVVEIK